MSRSCAILARLGLALLVQAVTSTLSYACLENNDPLYVACTEETPLTPLFRTIFGPQTRPRRIAVVMSISNYPNLPKKALASAGADGKMLAQTLKDLQFDEIIKISDQNFNQENLERIFTRYLPPLLKKQMNSQVFVTFSGHGNEYDGEGYLLLPTGKKLEISSYEDTTDGWLSMRRLRDILFDTVKYANQSLVLVNACKSGYFVTQREHYGEDVIANPTAQVITAGGPTDSVEADPLIGSFGGSIFFEMVNSALSNTPLRTARGPIPPPNTDGILSFWTLFSFLHDTSLAVSNRAIAPIPAAFMSKTQPPQAEGAFFFIVDKDKAKQTLANRFPDNYRTVFGDATQQRPSAGPSFSDLPDSMKRIQALPFDVNQKTQLSSGGDWAAYRNNADGTCFMETNGTREINVHIAASKSPFVRPIRQMSDGTQSRLRLVLDPKSRLPFLLYVTKNDLQKDYGKLFVGQVLVSAVASDVGAPVPYSPPGTLLFAQSSNITSSLSGGDYLLIEGYTSVYERDLTDTFQKLSERAKSFIRKKLRSQIAITRLVPVGGEPENSPDFTLQMLKFELKKFGRGKLSQEDDTDVQKIAVAEGLSLDDVFALGALKDEDLLPIVSAATDRERRFKDELSLWGFSATYSAMLASCSTKSSGSNATDRRALGTPDATPRRR